MGQGHQRQENSREEKETMKAQSFLHKVEDGKDPRKARSISQRPTTVGAVYTHVNKSRPGRKIREAMGK